MGVSIVKEDDVAKVHIEGWAGFRQTDRQREGRPSGRKEQPAPHDARCWGPSLR